MNLIIQKSLKHKLLEAVQLVEGGVTSRELAKMFPEHKRGVISSTMSGLEGKGFVFSVGMGTHKEPYEYFPCLLPNEIPVRLSFIHSK